MGWAALAFLALALALFVVALRINAAPTSADDRLGSLIPGLAGAVCALIAAVLWVVWVSLG